MFQMGCTAFFRRLLMALWDSVHLCLGHMPQRFIHFLVASPGSGVSLFPPDLKRTTLSCVRLASVLHCFFLRRFVSWAFHSQDDISPQSGFPGTIVRALTLRDQVLFLFSFWFTVFSAMAGPPPPPPPHHPPHPPHPPLNPPQKNPTPPPPPPHPLGLLLASCVTPVWLTDSSLPFVPRHILWSVSVVKLFL